MRTFDQERAAALFGEPAPWLRAQHAEARAAWLGAALPTRKTEAWKYTSIDALTERDYLAPAESGALPDPAAAQIDGLDADRLVFVDGRFEPALSSVDAQAGVTAVCFSGADPAGRELIAARLSTLATGTANPFVSLNGCWLSDGVLFHVRAGVEARRPLCVVHLGAADSGASAQRTLVILERGARAQLLEYFPCGSAARNALVTGTTEISLAEDAQLGHYRLQLEEEQAIHIGGLFVDLARASRYEGFLLGIGGRLKRLDVRVRHRAPGSECRMDGVYLARNTQHIDLHTTVEHESTNGTTQQVVRGIVDDRAHAVFNGRIHIHPQAQKTSADLSNRNLLLSNSAEIDAKPELEIYADDVRCSHGATVSRIDEKSLYYLQTRGIERAEAEVLLGFGFINELFERVPIEPLRKLLRKAARDWFGREERLMRHLA